MSQITELENPAALQLKVTHWVEMARYILEGFKEIPEGLTTIVTDTRIIASYPDGRVVETGDYTFKEVEYIVTEESQAFRVYEWLWDRVEEARVYNRLLKQNFYHV